MAISGMVEFDEALEAVGSLLRALRVERGVTLAVLAQSTGISMITLCRLKSGQRNPTLDTGRLTGSGDTVARA